MVMPTHIVAVGIIEGSKGNILLVKTRNGGCFFPGGQIETKPYVDSLK